MIASVSYPQPSKHRRTQIRKLLTASRIWVLEYVRESAPCDLCSPSRRTVTRTSITFSHSSQSYRICYKCVGRAHLKRERNQPQAEHALYGLGHV